MKIIFVPYSRGLAHVSRSLMIAEEMSKHHEVLFCIDKTHNDKLNPKCPVKIVRPTQKTDDATGFAELLTDFSYFSGQANYYMAFFKEERPDLVVVDLHLSAYAGALKLGINVVAVGHTTTLHGGLQLSGTVFPRFFPNMLTILLYTFVTRKLNDPVCRFASVPKSVVETQVTIVPEPDNWHKPAKSSVPAIYTGPLLWTKKDSVPSWYKDFKNTKGKKVYVTRGGTGLSVDNLHALAEALLGAGYIVVVSGEGVASGVNDARTKFSANYLDGEKVASQCDLVINSGGFGSLMQAIRAGTPSLCIPVNGEQYFHSHRAEQLGLAKNMSMSMLRGTAIMVTGNIEYFDKVSNRISTTKIVNQVNVMIANSVKYRKAIEDYKMTTDLDDGVKAACNAITDMIR